MFDTPDHILCHRLSQLYRHTARLEQWSQIGKLRYGSQLFFNRKKMILVKLCQQLILLMTSPLANYAYCDSNKMCVL